MRKIPLELETEILRLHFAEAFRIGTIATQLRVHHSVVRRVLIQAGLPIPRDKPRPSKLDPYLTFMHGQLEKYPRLPAARLFRMLQERGYQGGESRVREVVAQIRPKPKHEAFLRLCMLPAEQAQVDWAHFGKLPIGKAMRPLMAFVMVLAWSRKIFLHFFLDARMPSFLEGHVRAFESFGGVARNLLYDNLKSAVLERVGTAIRFNPTLLALASHYHFGPRAAAPARGNEKGRVERAIRYIRDSFFAGRAVKDVDELNLAAEAWCSEVADQRRWPQDREKTVAQVFLEEQSQLLALPKDRFPCEEMQAVTVGKRPYVRFDKNDYSIPHHFVRRELQLIASPAFVRFCQGPSLLAEYPRSYDKGQVFETAAHLQALIEQKHAASTHRGIDRLRHTVKAAGAFFKHAASYGLPLAGLTKKLLELLDIYGASELEYALCDLNAKGVVSISSLQQLLQQRRHAQGREVPLPVPLQDARLQKLAVRPHDLASYDKLSKK